MTVRECYERIGADYEDVFRRLGNDARIKRILGMLERDTSVADLRAALARGDYDAAFRAAHTFKGIALNLGLTNLTGDAIELTEALRGTRDGERIARLFASLDEGYARMLPHVRELASQPEEGQ